MKKNKQITGLSLCWDRDFIKNLVIVIGVVAVWRGMWNLMDIYIFPEQPFLSNGLCIVIGVLLLYLPDGSFHQMGDFSSKKNKK